MTLSKPYRTPENAMKAFLARPTLGEVLANAASFFQNTLEAEMGYLGVPVLNGGPHEGNVLHSLIEGDKIYFGAKVEREETANDNRSNSEKAA
jgi:hypothetical protein